MSYKLVAIKCCNEDIHYFVLGHQRAEIHLAVYKVNILEIYLLNILASDGIGFFIETSMNHWNNAIWTLKQTKFQ